MSEIELSRSMKVPAFRELVPGVVNVEVNDRPGGGGVQVRVTFENGYGASVVCGTGTYGGDVGLWELGVLGKDGALDYSTPVAADVIGWLGEAEVLEHLREVSALTADSISRHRRSEEAAQVAFELQVLLNRATAAGLSVSEDDGGSGAIQVRDATPGITLGALMAQVEWYVDEGRWFRR